MVWGLRFGVVWATVLVLVSGCMGADGGAKNASTATAESSQPGAAAKGDAVMIQGSVVDVELAPISDVKVTAEPGNHSTTTDSAGAYSLGPVEPGTYTLRGEKTGYKGKEVRVDVVSGEPARVVLTLEALPSTEGHFETKPLAGYIQCQFHLTSPVTLNVPCSTFAVEYFGGPKLLDSYLFPFEITAPGFREILVEATWQPSATVVGGAQFWIEPPTGGADFVDGTGNAPIRHKATAGIKNDGNDQVFYPKPDTPEKFRMGMIGFGRGTSTVPNFYHWIEWRYTIYLSFFYYGLVPADFTALPK